MVPRSSVPASALVGCSFLLMIHHQAHANYETNPHACEDRKDPLIACNVEIPMRDKTILKANLYLPPESGGTLESSAVRYPVLIFRTPYSKDEGDTDNERTFRTAAERGYVVMVQDVRGRYRSEGNYVPYVNEGQDGYDTIEWAAAQPWSDGQVGTFGLSYPGGVQWLAAVEQPPHLKAMVPAMCASSINEAIYFGGVFEAEWLNWVYRYMTPDTRVRMGLKHGPQNIAEATAFFNGIGTDGFQGYLPMLEIPYLRRTAPYYYDWLRHPAYQDAYWDWGDLKNKYSRVKAAVLNISGWYDEAYGPSGATKNFLGLRATRRDSADPATQLILGPWIHGVDAIRNGRAGDRSFPDAALDYDQIVLDWLDQYVRGIDRGVTREAPVRLFVMQENRWRQDTDWPPRDVQYRPLYLDRSAANDQRTMAWNRPKGHARSTFIADPADPVRDEWNTGFGGFDLRNLSKRSDVLVFDTAPLKEDLVLAGDLRAQLHVSTTGRDCDIYALLLDVSPDGTANNLMGPGTTVVRASYRLKSEKRQLLKPDQIVTLNFDRMRIGNMFQRGHRLRLVITASWYPTYARNLQNGFSEKRHDVGSAETIRIHHDRRHPSHLLLPMLGPQRD